VPGTLKLHRMASYAANLRPLARLPMQPSTTGSVEYCTHAAGRGSLAPHTAAASAQALQGPAHAGPVGFRCATHAHRALQVSGLRALAAPQVRPCCRRRRPASGAKTHKCVLTREVLFIPKECVGGGHPGKGWESFECQACWLAMNAHEIEVHPARQPCWSDYHALLPAVRQGCTCMPCGTPTAPRLPAGVPPLKQQVAELASRPSLFSPCSDCTRQVGLSTHPKFQMMISKSMLHSC
jgi:hypothetical protein